MEKTKYKGETVALLDCNPRDLIPGFFFTSRYTCVAGAKPFSIWASFSENREFWTYEGSLTTPTYKECVIWTIFRSSIPISRRQVKCCNVSKNLNLIWPLTLVQCPLSIVHCSLIRILDEVTIQVTYFSWTCFALCMSRQATMRKRILLIYKTTYVQYNL